MAHPDQYRPSRSDVDLPRKRQRRSHSPDNDPDLVKYGRGESYRPGGRASERPNKDRSVQSDSYRPAYKPANIPDQDRRHKKTKKDRKENPSTRIASLRKQLKRGGLPPPIQRERERELAALVFEREKRNIRQEHRKNLERYHFVRFIERQKASRKIKEVQRRRLQDENEPAGPERDASLAKIDEQIHILEVDFNYTKFAPLGEKYIALYAHEKSKNHPNSNPPDPANRKLYQTAVQPKHIALLDEDQLDQLQKEREIYLKSRHSIIHASGNLGEDEGAPLKPPRWYEIEEAMKEDEKNGNTVKLDAVRDGKTASTAATNANGLVLGLGDSSKVGDKRRSDWLDDNGEIDPEDLDSDSSDDNDVDMQDGGVKLDSSRSAKRDVDDGSSDDQDEDMSDGDGGFFERR